MPSTTEKSYEKILVVEDEVIVALDIAQTLSSYGYKVLGTVPSGEEALEILSKTKAHLVLMDIHLQGALDGIETAKLITDFYNIPIIYLTTYSDSDTISRAKITEPYGYITKSFDYRDLRSNIEMALYKHKMESRIKEKEELLSTIFKSISDSIVTTDREGRIKFINEATEKLLDVSFKEVEEKMITSLNFSSYRFDRQDKQLVFPFIDEKLDSGETALERFLLVLNKGRSIPVECRISPLQESQKEISGYVYVFHDITGQLKMEETYSRLISIVESSEDAIIGISEDGAIISWNQGAVKIFGYREEEVLGKNISILTPLYFPNEIPYILDGLVRGEVYDHYETIRQHRDGHILNISMKISAIRDREGYIHMVSVIARDITNRKKLEKQILEIEDRERTRIGQDLHDSLGQQLMGISLKLKALETYLDQENRSSIRRTVEEVSGLVKEAIHETRKIAKGLIPVALTSECLGSALLELVSLVKGASSARIEANIDEEISFPDPVINVQLYHIAQEALNNALRHSGGTRITIFLEKEINEIILRIADNGKGVEENNPKGLGLQIMKYRANVSGGQLSIYSNKGEGTTVICRIPWDNLK